MSDDLPPVLRVVSGHPDADELAALTAVVLSLTSRAAPRSGTTATGSGAGHGWGAHWRRVRATPPPGPDAWRMSSR